MDGNRDEKGEEIGSTKSEIQSTKSEAGNTKSEIRNTKDGGRDYTRQVYQNLMAVVEYLEDKSPLPVSHKQLRDALGLSKSIVFNVCWNLCKRGWAEDIGDGMVRLKRVFDGKEVLVGRQ